MKKVYLLLVSVLLVSLLFTPGCTKSFDITGFWNFVYFGLPATATFTGTEESGTVRIEITGVGGGTHNYTVNDLSVTIIGVWDAGASINATGVANEDHNQMSGTFTQNNGYSGAWSATR